MRVVRILVLVPRNHLLKGLVWMVLWLWVVWTTTRTTNQIWTAGKQRKVPSSERFNGGNFRHQAVVTNNITVEGDITTARSIEPPISSTKITSIEQRKATSSREVQFSNSSLRLPLWLLNYIEFHQSRIVQDPRSSGRLMLKPGTHYLLWSCKPPRCGGLADRLKGIVQAFYMAMCLDRVLLIEWEQPSLLRPRLVHQLSDYLLPNYINWDVGTPRISSESFTTISTMNQRQHPIVLEPSLLRHNKSIVRIEMNMNQFSDNRNSHCMQEYWARFPQYNDTTTRESFWWYDELFSVAFDVLFQWNPKVAAIAQQMKQRAKLSQPYIGLHVRVGGSHVQWNDPNRHSDPNQWQQFYTCGHRLQKALARKCRSNDMDQSSNTTHSRSLIAEETNIYLASDSVVAKKFLLEQDALLASTRENQSLSTAGSIRTVIDLDIVHIDRSWSKQRHGYYAVFAEFFILTEATCLITSRSGFSEIAAKVLTSTLSTVIAPDKERQNPAKSPLKQAELLYDKRCALHFTPCNHDQVQDAIRDVSCY